MVIRILGTSHISSESISAIKKEIKEKKPKIVGVELDIGRAQTLQSKQNKQDKQKIPWQLLPKIGVFGFSFVIIGRFVQQHLGKIVGVEPGSEMREAIVQAHKAKAHIVLIDRPIQLTLQSLSKQFGFKDKCRMIWDLISGPFSGKKRIKEMGINSFSLSGVPDQEVVVKMTGYIKKRYPGMYKALISERDVYMSRAALHILKKEKKHQEVTAAVADDPSFLLEPSILLVVGAGHVAGMVNYLRKSGVEVEVV